MPMFYGVMFHLKLTVVFAINIYLQKMYFFLEIKKKQIMKK